MIGESLGHYEVVALLGAGGMGRVFRARDTRLEREVAVKLLPEGFADDPDRLARFEREAKLLAALNHPNIAVVHGFEQAGAVPFIAMELIEGATLDEHLADDPPSLQEALGIARQIAEALEVAHDHGIIHRDLKPANVKVRPDGTVKVLDFGLAKLLARDGDTGGSPESASESSTVAVQTGTGIVMGTAPYMSPEQVRGRDVDARADLWAFGCVLFEALSGQRPFQRETLADTMSAILEHEPDWQSLPSGVPSQVVSLLRRCLRKDPRRRLHHAADARIEIEDALASLAGVAAPVEVATAAAHRAAASRHRAPWAIAAAAVAVAAVTLAAIAFDLIEGGGGSEAPPLRFQVPLPEGVVIFPGEIQTYIAVSPDGRTLAMAGNGTSDPLSLHSFADGASRPLAGTEGARTPFWSPDSRAVGFFAQGALKTVDTANGTVQVVTNASYEAGNSWSEAGVLLFSQPGPGGPAIHRVPATGGDPQPVTQVDPAHEIAHFWPHFLPDGRRFLYLVLERSSAAAPSRTLYVGSLDDDTRVALPGVASRAISVPGHLLYISEGSLVARPFDVDRLAFTGDPVRLAGELRFFQMTGQAEFSASQDPERPVVAFHGRPWVSRLVTYDRNGRRSGQIGEPAAYDQIRVAPDGLRMAVDVLDPGNGGRDLWIYNLTAERAPRRLTLDAADERDAVWSPDGGRIAYRSDRNGPPDLYARHADGSGDPQALLSLPTVLTPQDWSPRDDALLYHVSSRATGGDLSIVPLDGGGDPRPLLDTRYSEWSGRFGPAGDWLAFVSDEAGSPQVYIAPVDDPGARQPISTDSGIAPRWGRRGTELYYLGPDRTVMAVPITLAPSLQIGAPEPLFQLPARVYGDAFDVTPDGQMFVVNEIVEDTRYAPVQVIVNWANR